MKIMTAKYKGKCYSCDVRVKVGDQIEWDSITGTKHVDCLSACSQKVIDDLRKSESITQLGDFSAVYALFDVAATGGKWPRITINADGYEFFLYVSGSKAAVPNVINVKTRDKSDNPKTGWFGRITIDGAWDQRHKEVDERMADALSRLAMDPVGTVAMYGRLSGKCCFCKKQLTDPPSVEAGYGPICAKRWGLAWGGGKLLQPVPDGKVWGMTESGKYGPITAKQTVLDPNAVVNAGVQMANAPYVMAGSEYAGPSYKGVVIDEITDKAHIAAIKKTKAEWAAADHVIVSGTKHYPPPECEYCFGAKMIDGEACLCCSVIDEEPCEHCDGTGKVANTEPGADDVVCMGCAVPQWCPDAEPIDHPAGEPIDWKSNEEQINSLAEIISKDAAAPKETVTLKTKMITAEVNIPKELQFKMEFK